MNEKKYFIGLVTILPMQIKIGSTDGKVSDAYSLPNHFDYGTDKIWVG